MLILHGAKKNFALTFAVVNQSAPIKQNLAADCTTRGILTILKEKGPTDASTLGELLCISAPGIRQHLYDLQEKELVTFVEEPRPKGRPAKIWKLTSEANNCFPDNHAAVSLTLLKSAKAAFGKEGLCQLLSQYAKEQTKTYKQHTHSCPTIRDRLIKLVACRSQEGYMAEISEDENGNLLLIENHCPIACAAQSCSEFCDGELRMFNEVLGPGVDVKRLEHMVDGQRRCVYRITENDAVINN